MHPGVVRTDIMVGFRRGWIGVLFWLVGPVFGLLTKSAEEGAETVLMGLF